MLHGDGLCRTELTAAGTTLDVEIGRRYGATVSAQSNQRCQDAGMMRWHLRPMQWENQFTSGLYGPRFFMELISF